MKIQLCNVVILNFDVYLNSVLGLLDPKVISTITN